MDKNRLTAFIDAVLAISMTLMVFNLKAPATFDLQGFWALRAQFFAYSVSYFWLGTMWVNLHNEWHDVKTVKRSTAWLSVVMLFFSSLFPYATMLISEQFDNRTVQAFYGIVVLGVTFANTAVYRSIGLRRENRFIIADIVLKILALILSVTVFPPAFVLTILLLALYIAIASLREKK